jgi:hypothetical protein
LIGSLLRSVAGLATNFSTARIAWAWAARNCRQVGPDLGGRHRRPARPSTGGGGDAVAESDQGSCRPTQRPPVGFADEGVLLSLG